MCEASKGRLPGNSRGIELVSSSGKITTICPEGNRNVFMSWLNALRDIIGKLNLERYRRTRDREYRRDVSEVDPGRFGNRHWMIYDHLWLMWIRIMLIYASVDRVRTRYIVGYLPDRKRVGNDKWLRITMEAMAIVLNGKDGPGKEEE